MRDRYSGQYGPARDYEGHHYRGSGLGHGGSPGHLQPLPEGGQRWGAALESGEVVVIVAKRDGGAGTEVLEAEDGQLYRPVPNRSYVELIP